MKLSEKFISEDQKIKIGIFIGGPSSEREISLESGRHIYNNLNEDKYDRYLIFIDRELKFWLISEAQLWLNTTEDITTEIETGAAKPIEYQELPQIIEFAFLGVHGKYVEDGSLQGLLEILNLPYNGPSVLGSALGMDKLYIKKIFKAEGINSPNYQSVSYEQWLKNKESILSHIETEIKYPIIIKPSREGCSTAITKASNREELEKGINSSLDWDTYALCEEFIDGQEITCTIIGNDNPIALEPTETPKNGEFLTVEEKFLPGGASMITPPTGWNAETVDKVKKEFIRVYKALHLSVYTRIDAFWKDGKLIILEPNTLPGVTPSTMVFHQAAEAGMSPSQFFDKLIELSIEAFEKKVGPRT